MKNKTMLICIIGFGAGGLCGYFFGKTSAKKQFLEDLSDLREFYMEKLENLGVMDKEFDPSQLIETAEVDLDEVETKEYFDNVVKYSSAATTDQGIRGKGRPIIKYNKPPLDISNWGHLEPEPEEPEEEFEDPDDPEEQESDEELEARAEEFAKRRHENQSNGLPYVIDFDEYQDAPEGYERQDLYYYAEDRVLCEDDDTMVEDEEGLVGLDYEDILDYQTNVWVRNDAVMALYAIHRLDDSYSKSVANVAETSKERDLRILSRRKQGLDS